MAPTDDADYMVAVLDGEEEPAPLEDVPSDLRFDDDGELEMADSPAPDSEPEPFLEPDEPLREPEDDVLHLFYSSPSASESSDHNIDERPEDPPEPDPPREPAVFSDDEVLLGDVAALHGRPRQKSIGRIDVPPEHIVAFGSGHIKFYEPSGRFIAQCVRHGCNVCFKGRGARDGKKDGQGNPIGFLAAWLECGEDPELTLEQHLALDSKDFDFDWRDAARDLFAELPNGALLISKERGKSGGKEPRVFQ